MRQLSYNDRIKVYKRLERILYDLSYVELMTVSDDDEEIYFTVQDAINKTIHTHHLFLVNSGDDGQNMKRDN